MKNALTPVNACRPVPLWMIVPAPVTVPAKVASPAPLSVRTLAAVDVSTTPVPVSPASVCAWPLSTSVLSGARSITGEPGTV